LNEKDALADLFGKVSFEQALLTCSSLNSLFC